MTSTDTTSAPNASSRRRLAGGLFAGVAALTLPVAAFGGIGHAAEQPSHQSKCDGGCVLALADSDGDGSADLWEVAAGSDPLDATSTPAPELTRAALEQGVVVHVSLGGASFVTVADGLPVDLDVTVLPDGVHDITSTLVDPVTGTPFSRNHYGIDAGSSGLDVAGIDRTVNAGGPSSSTNSGPKGAPPELIHRGTGPVADGDPQATDPPATDPPASDPPASDPPATDPPVGGEKKDDKKPDGGMRVWENEHNADGTPTTKKSLDDAAAKAKRAAELAQCVKSPSSCPGGQYMTNPDAPVDGTNDLTQPPVDISPADPVRGDLPTIEAPTGPVKRAGADPHVADPNPEADPKVTYDADTPPNTNPGNVDFAPGLTPPLPGRP